MRARTILLAAVAAAGLALVSPAAAWAEEARDEGGGHHGFEVTEEDIEHSEEESDLGHHEFVCLVEQLEQISEGHAVDTCEEAPNPILPEINEVIWAVVSFAVLFFLLARFAFPAIRKGLEGREQAIRDDLEGAEKTRTEAEETLRQYQQQLAEAHAEAGRIIEEARQAADAVRRDAQAQAEAEAGVVRDRAQAELDQSVGRARADLQREMGDFAVRLAERIVERNLDPAAQQDLIDRYIAEVGTGSASGNGGSAGDA